MNWTTGVQFLAGGTFFLLTITSRPALRSTQPPFHCVPGTFSPGREVDYSPTASAEVKLRIAIPPLYHTYSWRRA